MNLTEAQIAELAPDAASLKAGRHLSSQSWVELGASERALWGAIFGSGAKPYRVAVDLCQLAYKCTCPSRKFPCKHVLALMLRAANNNMALSSEPEWVANWLEARAKRREAAESKAATSPGAGPAAATVEPEADGATNRASAPTAAANVSKPEAAPPAGATARPTPPDRRATRVAEGLETLKARLSDIVRVGISALTPENEPWRQAATRLVDAQAPGVAKMVEELGTLERDERWGERLLGKLGLLALLAEAYSRVDALPYELACELRQTIGWTIPQSSVLSEGELVVDRWLSLGSTYEQQGHITAKRAWFLGLKSGRFALHLQFGHGRSPSFPEHVPTGVLRYQSRARFFPGVQKVRALWEDTRNSGALMSRAALPLDAAIDFTALRERYADALSAYPWRRSIPAILRGVAVRPNGAEGCVVVNGEAQALPCVAIEGVENFVASSASEPIELFGEWSGEAFYPITAWRGGFCDAL